MPFLRRAWAVDPISIYIDTVYDLAGRRALTPGYASNSDAVALSTGLASSDLVFIDPPYSAVQYSRFYHVLEAIAVGGYPEVSGAGRMPPSRFRRRSDFSRVARARSALDNLLQSLARQGSSVIVTFPAGTASNNLSGALVERTCRKYFEMEVHVIEIEHSTLGGPRDGRGTRRVTSEMIFVMRP